VQSDLASRGHTVTSCFLQKLLLASSLRLLLGWGSLARAHGGKDDAQLADSDYNIQRIAEARALHVIHEE
jgi:hypothetical protein